MFGILRLRERESVSPAARLLASTSLDLRRGWCAVLFAAIFSCYSACKMTYRRKLSSVRLSNFKKGRERGKRWQEEEESRTEADLASDSPSSTDSPPPGPSGLSPTSPPALSPPGPSPHSPPPEQELLPSLPSSSCCSSSPVLPVPSPSATPESPQLHDMSLQLRKYLLQQDEMMPAAQKQARSTNTSQFDKEKSRHTTPKSKKRGKEKKSDSYETGGF